MIKWISKFLDSQDPSHSSVRLNFIITLLLIVEITQVVLYLAIWRSDIAVAIITALTVFAGTIFGQSMLGKYLQSREENKSEIKP